MLGNGEVVEFTEEAVKAYLDQCIREARRKRDEGESMYVYYIDAYQSVRASLFDELLLEE